MVQEGRVSIPFYGRRCNRSPSICITLFIIHNIWLQARMQTNVSFKYLTIKSYPFPTNHYPIALLQRSLDDVAFSVRLFGTLSDYKQPKVVLSSVSNWRVWILKPPVGKHQKKSLFSAPNWVILASLLLCLGVGSRVMDSSWRPYKSVYSLRM